MTGIILKALSSFYYVEREGVIYECKARGNFRKSGISPLVGDKVEFDITEGEKGIVNSILPRKNALIRPNVANIDKLFIVSSYSTPAPNAFIIDKIAAIAEYNDIEPIIVFNKCDMGDFTEWENIYKNAGFKTFTVSAEKGEGIEALLAELSGSVSAFTGNSGVGKSSILNCVFGNKNIETGAVSEKLGRGRHTTRHIEAYRLQNGGIVVDTPGFSSLDYTSRDYKFKENLAHYFRDFGDSVYECKFSTCSHTKESGCGVLKAVKDGKIEPTRHSSYVQLFEEMKDLKPWEADNYKKR
jgi:ribosome biogenesis GTPase